MFGCRNEELPDGFSIKLDKINTFYWDPKSEELEEYILDVLKKISLPQITRTEEENLKAFENGWRENSELIKANGITINNLKPKYFRQSKFLRYAKKLIVSKNLNLEYELFTLARLVIFKKYLSGFETIYELGAGSCQNLLMLSELYPNKELYGLDWTNVTTEIADYIASSLGRNIKGYLFDMMEPPANISLKPGSAVFSIHSLEQIGNQHEKLLSFILNSSAGIVVHYEPILELYDENNLLDKLALIYSDKRNYLNGYLNKLRDLERQNKIEIIEARRPHLGGVIHEASLVVWRPI